ncbi:MAG: single-stranded DNA-binding protein [Acidimicrobiia bacterium]
MEMDLNLIVLCGSIATEPEIRIFESGTRLIRYLVTVRSEAPRRRVDVVPVIFWDPSDEEVAEPGKRGQRIWIGGSVQRRFWESPDGRRSRLEVIAEQINLKEVEELEPVTA